MNHANLCWGPDIKPLQAGPEACKVPACLFQPGTGQTAKASAAAGKRASPKINLKDENEP